MGIRRHAWLQLQEVDVGASVERHGGDLGVRDDNAILRALRFHLQRVALYVHRIGNGPELHRDVDAEIGIRVDLYPGLRIIPEALLAGGDVIAVNIKSGKSIEALGVGDRLTLHICGDAGGDDGHAGDYGAAGVSDYSGDRTGYGCPSRKRSQE